MQPEGLGCQRWILLPPEPGVLSPRGSSEVGVPTKMSDHHVSVADEAFDPGEQLENGGDVSPERLSDG
jgi:hypothetical protein